MTLQAERPRGDRKPEAAHAALLTRIAVLETQIVHLRETIAAGDVERSRILAEIAELKLLVAQIKGAWRVIGAACGALGLVAGAILPPLVKTLIGG